MVNKQLYYSCQLIINDQEDLKTKDIKGVEPQWKLRQIVSAGNFSDPKVMVFQISHVAYPQRRETLKIVGEARLTTKRIKTMNTKHFDISVSATQRVHPIRCFIIGPKSAFCISTCSRSTRKAATARRTWRTSTSSSPTRLFLPRKRRERRARECRFERMQRRVPCRLPRIRRLAAWLRRSCGRMSVC